jgi:hypothetical protein
LYITWSPCEGKTQGRTQIAIPRMIKSREFRFLNRSGPPPQGIKRSLEISEARSHAAALSHGERREKGPELGMNTSVAGERQRQMSSNFIVPIIVDSADPLSTTPRRIASEMLIQHNRKYVDPQHRSPKLWSATIAPRLSNSSMMPWAGHSAYEVELGTYPCEHSNFD